MVELGQHAARTLGCLPCASAVRRMAVWRVVRAALATYAAVATHLTTRAHSSVWGGAVHYGGGFWGARESLRALILIRQNQPTSPSENAAEVVHWLAA